MLMPGDMPISIAMTPVIKPNGMTPGVSGMSVRTPWKKASLPVRYVMSCPSVKRATPLQAAI
jgi:hypothetical protein